MNKENNKKVFNFNFLLILFLVLIIVMIIPILIRKSNNSKYGCEDCNIIIVSLEILRNDHLPCYGYYKNTAPNLCEFSKKSILFENHYTQEPYSLPATATLFTSLYPSQHKLRFILKDKLPENILTLAQILKDAGYTTYWSAPFDDPWVPLDKGLEKGFMYFEQEIRNNPIHAWKNTIFKAKEKPKFFAFLHTFKIHEPYIPTNTNLIKLFTDDDIEEIPTTEEEFQKKFRKNIAKSLSEIIDLIDMDTKITYKKLFLQPTSHEEEIIDLIIKKQEEKSLSEEVQTKLWNIGSFTWQEGLADKPRQIEFLKGLYDTQIYETDIAIAELLNILQEERLLDNTILIFYSPLGESFNEHKTGFSHATDLYQHSINTPLIVYLPKMKSKRIVQSIQTIDIVPTLLDVLKIMPPNQLEGISFLPYLQGTQSGNPNKYVFSQLRGGLKSESIVKDNQWKLILNYGNGQISKELYNIITDYEEKNNLVNQYPEISYELENILKDRKARMKNYFYEELPFPEWLDEKTRHRLQEKGYF